MPDYFDRLVTKGDPGGDVVRVRPRLPGPFERIDALGAARVARSGPGGRAARSRAAPPAGGGTASAAVRGPAPAGAS